MTSPEVLVRTILGPVRSNIRPLALAVDITAQLLFLQHFAMDDIRVTKLIYPDVAKLLHSKPDSTARRVIRLTHLCWDALVEQNLVRHYVGRDLRFNPDPHDILLFLAVFSYLDTPFFTVIDRNPQALFLMPSPSSPVLLSPVRLPLPVTQAIALPSSNHSALFPVCTACNCSLEREYQSFCDRCGQPLNWIPFRNAKIIYPASLPPLP